LQEDINTIHKASNFEEAIAELHKEFDPIEINKDTVKNAVHYQGLGRFLKLVLYLIVYKNQAADWFTRVRLGFFRYNEINRDFTIEVHHFPKSLLKSVGYSEDRQEALANIVFVNPGTNKRLRDEPHVILINIK
jgi:hypothetical protein